MERIMNEFELLEKIKLSYQNILQDDLTGIYVHGSIALGCFNWEKSDIDFLVVVRRPLMQEEKEELISSLLDLDVFCPPKGVEMSVVLEQACSPFVYPTPFELHFSNTHKENARKDLSGYCRTMNGVDPDLAAHITITRKAGIVLCGKAVDEVFAPVPKEDYLDSIRADVECAREEIGENPVYFVLNLCRVLAYVKEDLILSKRQGGEWAVGRVPEKYVPVIQKALECYESDREFEPRAGILKEFVEEMLRRINSRLEFTRELFVRKGYREV